MFSFKCPGCDAMHSANEEFLGIRAKCLRCGEILVVGEKQPRRVGRKKTGSDDSGASGLRLLAEADTASETATLGKPTKSPSASTTPATKSADRDPPEKRESQITPGEDKDTAQDEDKPFASRRKRWTALVSAVALLLLGSGIYFLFFIPRAPERLGPVKESPSASQAIAKSQPIEPSRSADAKDEGEQPDVPAPVSPRKPIAKGAAPVKPSLSAKKPIIASNKEPIRVSVNQLHRRQLADAAAASREYDRKLLDLHGSCARYNVTAAGLRMAFAVDREAEPFVLTVLPATVVEPMLRHIIPGQSVTLRGVYEATGKLHDAEVIRTQTAGDEMYHGKQVEIMGHFGQIGLQEGDELSSLRFEPDATDRIISVECMFKKTDGNQVEGFKTGQYVIVRGRCGVQTFNTARLHNCQIVYDYAARSDAPRLQVGRFIDDYEQDLRDSESAEQPDDFAAVSVVQLLEAYKDPAKGSKLYLRRGLEVDGMLEAVDAVRSAVVLEGGTEQGLKVKCLFSPAKFRRLKTAPRMRIQGVCAGVEGKFIRLDNCEALQPAPAPEMTGPRLDAEFLPFRQGNALVYETAYHSGSSNRAALQQVLNFREDRILQFVATQTGQLKSKNGLGGGVNWTKKNMGTLPLLQHYRLHGGRVEISPSAAGPKGQPTGVWEPVLTVGAQANDSWTWNSAGQKSVYTVVEFSDYETRPSAVVKKTTESANSPVLTETQLVYARGIGEVSRKVYEVPGKGSKRLITETHLAK